MIYYGLISEVKDDKARVVVGKLTTDYLPVFQLASSYKRSWVPIKEKEQCIILAPFEDINNGCILRGLYYSNHPAPHTGSEKELTVYEDGTEISYDIEKSELHINAVKDITIICDKISVSCKDAEVTAENSIKAECTTAELTAKASIKAECTTAELTAKAGVTVACVKADVNATGAVTVTSPSVDLGGAGGTGLVTQQCICTITGLPHPDASKTVRALY